MKKTVSILKYIGLLLISFALLYLAFRGMNINKIISTILHANYFWVLLSTLISIVALISRAYRWKMLIESTGHSSPIQPTFYALMVGYFANLAFPRLGEVTRCGSLSKAIRAPFSKLLGTVIVERIVDVISLLICLLLAAVIEYKRLGNFLQENIIQPIIHKFNQLIQSPLFVVAGIVLLLAAIAGMTWFIKRSSNKGKTSALYTLANGLVEGLRSIAKLKRPGLFIFHSIFIWVLYFLSVYVCLFALPATATLGAGPALFLLVAGGLGMSAPVQGGIGAYHLLVSRGLVVYGLTLQDGLAFATLVHSLSLIVVVILGIISLLLLFAGKKKNAWLIQDPLSETQPNDA